MLNRHFFLFVFFIFLQVLKNSTFAQNQPVKEPTVTGTIIDSVTHQPVEFASVFLLHENKEVITGTFTSVDGTFEFKNVEIGNYVICISLIGYKKYYSKEFSINSTETMDLGYISMQEEGSVIDEIVIKSKKKLIQNNGDKLVYNANADIGNKAGSAIDVLRNTPMVTVDANGGIKLRGNSNIKILINGVPSNIMAKNLKEALKSIPAGTIESIEVITTPSAKYEAEGAAGIINIVTKKKTRGTNGNIDLTAGNLEQSLNAETSITRKKFSYNFGLGLINEKEKVVSEQSRISLADKLETGKLFQHDNTTQRYTGLNSLFSLEYRADSTQNIGASIAYWRDNMPINSSLYNLSEIKQDKLEYNQTNEQNNHFDLINFSLNYQKKFKRKAQELQLIGQYSNIAEKSDYKTNQFNLTGLPYFAETGFNKGKNSDLSFQADYAHPIHKTGRNILETGVRYGRNSSTSDYSVSNNVLGEDTSRSDEMNYVQTIFATYLSLKFETKNNWVIRPGLRYEATRLGGDFKRNETSFKTSFDNWVPSILISKKRGEKHDFKMNYTERIRRPEIWDLNPYINASDPKNITYGNPHLRPEITRTIELGYTYSAASGLSINNSLFFNSNKNGIEYLSIVDSLGISRTNPQNIAAIKRIGLNTNIYMPINENWTISGDVEIYHVWFDSKALMVKNDATIYSIGINSSYDLPADFTMQLSADYNNGLTFLQGKSSFYYTYRFSIEKEFFNSRASLTINVNNPFRRNQLQRTYLNATTFYSKTSDRHYDRSFTITFSWRFGGFQFKDRNAISIPETDSIKGRSKKH